VADRVELVLADMRKLRFEDGSFHVLVSNVAVHNVKGSDRDRAVDEIARLLRPGGRVLIADIFGTRRYCLRLAELGGPRRLQAEPRLANVVERPVAPD
jgi:arsenite methyltransferase